MTHKKTLMNSVMIIGVMITLILVVFLSFGSYSGCGCIDGGVPAGQWEDGHSISENEGVITFGTFTTDISIYDIKIFIKVNGTYTGSIFWDYADDNEVKWIDGPEGATVAFDDGGDIEKINNGDHLTLGGLSPNTHYDFEIFHIPSESTVHMTGTADFVTDG